MFIEEDLQSFCNQRKKFKDIGMLDPNENHYKIMELVSKSINNSIDRKKEEKKTFEESVSYAVDSFKIIDEKYIDELIKISFMQYDDLDKFDFMAIIEFIFTSDNKIKNKTGKVHNIEVPNLFTETSKIWLGHEFIHSLKETNYYEYINKNVNSEVLPLLYEMIVSNSIFSDIHDKWKYNRLNILIRNKIFYDEARRNINDKKNSDTYRFIMESYGQYLSSYYYANNLYHIYRKDEKKVLKYMKKVLDHKKTTSDLLKEFNLNNITENNINIYKYEHKNN